MILFVTSPDRERVVAIAACYNGLLEAGEKLLGPLRAFGQPLADTICPMRYGQVQTMFDESFPAGTQNYWKSSFLDRLDETTIETIVERIKSAPSPNSAILIEQFGGAVTRVSPEATAFSHRTARYNLLLLGNWADAGDKDKNVSWVRSLSDALSPFASRGVYVNYLGDAKDEGHGRIEAVYGSDNFARLVALKNRYDPGNLFRLNQNIQPTTGRE